MVLIHDTFTATNIAGFYETASLGADPTMGEKLFPARKQFGLTIDIVKGAKGRPVILHPSAFDTKAVIRDRIAVELDKKQLPYFKESMIIKEEDRQRLNELAMTGNQDLINHITSKIFDDQTALVEGAKVRLEAMRMQVLATGKIAIDSNGSAYDYDFGVADTNKKKVTHAWSDSQAKPLDDLEAAIDALSNLGYMPEIVIMNNATFNLMKNHANTVAAINPVTKAKVKKQELLDYIADNFGTRVEFKNGTYTDENGKMQKYFPDDAITIMPNIQLGETVFGTTPEESDLMTSQVANVSIVETGVAVTTTKETDPVNVSTKVSMIALPSFENIDACYFLNVGLDEV